MFNSVPFEAFFWGGVSAVSLPLGAVLGLWSRPSKKVTSALMAFGGGSLLFALSIELFGHVLHMAGDGHGHIVRPGLVLAAAFAAVVGGLLFNGLNRLLETRGGFLRKAVLIQRHVAKERREDARQLLRSLSRVDYFRSLPTEDVIKLLPDVQTVEFAAGDKVLIEGETGDRLYVINVGTVTIERDGGNGEPQQIAVLGPGNVIGEMALVTDQPRSASAVAATPVRAWTITKDAFARQVENSPRFGAAIRNVVEHRIHDLEDGGHFTVDEADDWEQRALGHFEEQGVADVKSSDVQQEQHEAHGNPALAIWLGIALDGIPESLVIGMLVVAAAAADTTLSLAFIVGVFLANLPEAMSSAVTMQNGGMKYGRIVIMWGSLCVMTAVGGYFGAVMLPADPTGWHLYLIFMMEGLAGGAMLTMIAQTMMPEAFEHGGGPVVGYSTLGGFLAALLAKLIG